MNVIGQVLTVLSAKNKSLTSRTGIVVLESANTLMLQTASKLVTVQKSGTAFEVKSSGTILTGNDLAGRLEDRLGKP